MPKCKIHKRELQCPACIGGVKSEAKAQAARINGAKSKGRPKKVVQS